MARERPIDDREEAAGLVEEITALAEFTRVHGPAPDCGICMEMLIARPRSRIAAARIGYSPCGGRPRDDLAPGLRTVPFEHAAVIADAVEAERVRVANLFYGRQDFEAP